MMITTKKFNARMAEANKTNKKNTIVASAAAGLTGIIAAGITVVVAHSKNKKIDAEINNLKTDVATLNTAVTTTVDIIAATTSTASADNDTDTKTNIKYTPINIYGYSGSINNKIAIYTKAVSGSDVTFSAVTNPTLEGYNFSEKYYVVEADYNKLYPTKETTTEEKTEDKVDSEKK